MKKTIHNIKELGELAKNIVKTTEKKKVGFVALVGDLGVGKTTLTKEVAKTLEIKDNITSPTFIVWKKYKTGLKDSPWENLVHADLYRIKDKKDLEKTGLIKEVGKKNSLVVVEWADKIKEIIPKNSLWVSLKHGEKSNERIIRYELKN